MINSVSQLPGLPPYARPLLVTGAGRQVLSVVRSALPHSLEDLEP